MNKVWLSNSDYSWFFKSYINNMEKMNMCKYEKDYNMKNDYKMIIRWF